MPPPRGNPGSATDLCCSDAQQTKGVYMYSEELYGSHALGYQMVMRCGALLAIIDK